MNYLVDPFGIYFSSKNRLVEQNQDYKESHLRLHKAREIVRLKPKILLAGSSRVRAGLTEDALVNSPLKNAFNLGLPGTTMEEVYYYLEHAFFYQPSITTIVLGLDLFQFNLNKKLNVEFDFNRLKRSTMTIQDLIDTLFTSHALKGSIILLKEKFFDQAKPEVLTKTKESNYRFDKKEEFFLRHIMNSLDWYKNFEFDPKQIEFFYKIINRCTENDIELKVFISPASADFCEAMTIAGVWQKFEQFKEIVAEKFPVWDFSGYNSITTFAAEPQPNQFYVDSSHYTSVVGKMIVSRLYDNNSGPDDFGVLLTPENIKEHHEKLRKDQAAWKVKNQSVTEYIKSLATTNLKWENNTDEK